MEVKTQATTEQFEIPGVQPHDHGSHLFGAQGDQQVVPEGRDLGPEPASCCLAITVVTALRITSLKKGGLTTATLGEEIIVRVRPTGLREGPAKSARLG